MDRLDRVAALVVAALVVAMGAVVSDRVGDEADPPAPDPVESLVDAYARSRTATYRAVGTWVREQEGGNRLELPVEFVQRPPDRLRREIGPITGHRGDRGLLCARIVDGEPQCDLGPPGRPFDRLAAGEAAEFAALVTGDDPLYEVRRPVGPAGPGPCWLLSRTRPDPRGGYGREAELCFDPDSGALAVSVIDHGTLVETIRYTDITTDVTDAMLEP